MSTTTVPTTTEDPEIIAMREVLDREVIYAGIWIGDLNLSGKTRSEAEYLLQEEENDYAKSFRTALKLGDSTWSINAADAGVSSNWKDQLEYAWNTGRTGSSMDQNALIRERFSVIEQLKTEPLKLEISRSWSKDKIRQKLESIASDVNVAATPAKAIDFDVDSKDFTIAERKPGRKMLVDKTLELITTQLKQGDLSSTVDVVFETTHTGMTAAELGKDLQFVSEGKTYAKAANEPRDINIRLILKALNGMVMNPGDSFSFNKYIGRRTKERGYQLAGGIIGGILIDTYGGGICQPNTTLYQAVLKADLQIDERHPHSWPSSYTDVGLDATVSWSGPDFKFTNSSDYPIAFVAYYNKPAIIVRLYGQPLPDGATITLKADITESIPANPPKRTYNSELPAGTVKIIRDEHIGMRAVSYKIWSKNGSVFKNEVVAKSYYRPLSGIEEYGPALPTPAPTTAEPTAAPTTDETTAAPTTAETTAAPTTAEPTATTTTTETTTTPTPAESTEAPTTETAVP